MALEPDCDHVTITGLEAEWSRHLDVSGKNIIDTETEKNPYVFTHSVHGIFHLTA